MPDTKLPRIKLIHLLTVDGLLDCWCDPAFYRHCDDCDTGCWKCEDGEIRLTREQAEMEGDGLIIVHNEEE